MKSAIIIAITLPLFFCCKKKEEAEPPAPTTIKTGAATIFVQVYDSMGLEAVDFSNIRIFVDATHSVNAGTDGSAIFTNLNYGDYFPNILKDNFEGAPFKLSITSPNLTFTVPLAQKSTFKTKTLTAQIVTRDSILLNFSLDKSIPSGKSVKMALIAGPNNNLANSNYESADIFSTISTVNQLNIAKFARFKNYVAGLDSNAVFYINVLPVSYGEYVSNVGIKPLLLGDNPIAPDNWLLKKDWKK